MKTAEIISVGEELLRGNVVDTNAAFLSASLRESGFEVRYRQTCGDEEKAIAFSLELALSRADLVLVTGGLGPTYDDITRKVCADVFGVALLHDEKVEASLRAYFRRRGVTMSENNLLQAQVPQGAMVLENEWGTAPGLWLKGGKGSAVLLPGVPSEMKAIFQNRVLPLLKEEGGERSKTCILRFYGISESLLDEKLKGITSQKNPVIAPYAGNGEVELHVTAFHEDLKTAEELCEEAKKKVLSLVGEYCYGEGKTDLETVLVQKALKQGITLATAESCTGGLLSQRITSVAGASGVFSLGICTYSEEEKKKQLGVREETLTRFGVYSKECAEEMAQGIRKKAGASFGIGITGIAGPQGGTEQDPVGTVYIAVSSENQTVCERTVFGRATSSRDQIRCLASSKALAMALSFLQKTDL